MQHTTDFEHKKYQLEFASRKCAKLEIFKVLEEILNEKV